MNIARKLDLVTLAEFEAMEKDEHCKYELIDGIFLHNKKCPSNGNRKGIKILTAKAINL